MINLVASIFVSLMLFGPFCIAQDKADSNETEFRRFELAGHFTFLRRANADAPLALIQQNFNGTSDFDPPELTELGLGARLGFRFTKHIAIEAEATFFPDDKRSNPIIGVPIEIVEPGGRKFQAVAGPKIGYKGRRFGLFGKVRPGLIRFDRYDAVVDVGPPGDGFYVISSARKGVGFLNVDVGGVFEYYPTKRTIFRVDVGDTIIRYRSLEPEDINPSFTRHNLQVNVGFGFRF